MDEMDGGGEMDPRQAAIQALMKYLRESEAKAVAPPQAPAPEAPAEGAPPAPAEGGGGEMTPEMLQALQSLMG